MGEGVHRARKAELAARVENLAREGRVDHGLDPVKRPSVMPRFRVAAARRGRGPAR